MDRYVLFCNPLPLRCPHGLWMPPFHQVNGKPFLTFGPSDFVNRITTSRTNDGKFFANHGSKIAKWVDMGWTWKVNGLKFLRPYFWSQSLNRRLDLVRGYPDRLLILLSILLQFYQPNWFGCFQIPIKYMPIISTLLFW